jgi:hypothetical protein
MPAAAEHVGGRWLLIRRGFVRLDLMHDQNEPVVITPCRFPTSAAVRLLFPLSGNSQLGHAADTTHARCRLPQLTSNRLRSVAMVARQLVFYKWCSLNAKPPFVYHDALKVLDDKIAGDPGFAIVENDDVTTAVTVATAGSNTQPAKVQLLALRSPDHRPSQWTPGAPLGPLPLQDDHYPADVTHVMIWPDGIAAQDLHANAPRLGRLSFYLRHQVSAYVSFEPLYQPDMLERLEQLRGQLRLVEVSLTRPEYFVDNRGAFQTLVPSVFGSRAPSVSVHIGMGRRGPRDRFLDDATEEAVFQIAENAHDQVDRLVIGGRNRLTGKSDRVNLLSERLQEKVEITAHPDVPALPDEHEVFEGLSKAYRSFRVQGLLDRAVQAQAMRPR